MGVTLDCFSWIKLILKDRELSFHAKALAMYFSTFMNLDQDCAWPGYRRICDEMHCTPKTVKKYIDELVMNEYLIVTKQMRMTQGGHQELNKYIINIPTKVLSDGKHLIEKVLSVRTKGTSHEDQKVLPHGKHNNNKNNNINNNTTDDFSIEKPSRNAVPFKEIVNLYHELLSELPRVEKLTKQRQGFIRQRWQEDLKELDHWRNYFNYVKKSDFLMGRAPPREGKPPFRADLEWLTRPGNYAKIAEDKYHG